VFPASLVLALVIFLWPWPVYDFLFWSCSLPFHHCGDGQSQGCLWQQLPFPAFFYINPSDHDDVPCSSSRGDEWSVAFRSPHLAALPLFFISIPYINQKFTNGGPPFFKLNRKGIFSFFFLTKGKLDLQIITVYDLPLPRGLDS